MRFGIITENNPIVRGYIKLCEDKFNKNEIAKRVVSRKFFTKKSGKLYVIGVDFWTLFPSFKIIAVYVLVFGIIAKFLFGFTLIPAIIGSCILIIPDFLMTRRFIAFVMKLQLRKYKYKGYFQVYSEKEMGDLIKWDA